MARTRALMTKTERARIAGEEDVEDIKRYKATARVRGRIKDELTEDIRVLEEHHPGLLEELREVACGDTTEVSAAAEPAAGDDDDRAEEVTEGEESGGRSGSEDTSKVIPGADLDDVDEEDDRSQGGLSDDWPGDEDLTERVRSYLKDRPPATTHGTEALLDSFRLLRENNVMKTGEMKEELSKKYGDRYSSTRAMWETMARYLEDIPGVTKGGYGEWEYAGDDVTREELAAAE